MANIAVWGSLVKFSHSVFALPFALAMVAVVARLTDVRWQQLLAIVICVVAARTAAMAYNRLVDHAIDAENPRTASRELPRGALSRASVWSLVVISTAVFVGGAAYLGQHCLLMTPLVLLVILGYSWFKRFSALSHLALGLGLACAPGGVWYAFMATFDPFPMLLMAAVLLWVAGFDVLYACQDETFDRARGLHSIPARLGRAQAMMVSKFLHAACVVFLLAFGFVGGFGAAYWAGVAIFGALLVSQHRLVSPTDLSRIDAAFFTRNGLASCVFFVAVVVDRWWV